MEYSEAKKLLRAWGYGSSWNFYKPVEFQSVFGFDALSYPQYFKLSPNYGYVQANKLFYTHCANLSSQLKSNTNMLTELS